jgi:uncharacterized protein YdeI (YjbR/CyaY-like superfamily)
MDEPLFFNDAAAFRLWLTANAADATALLVGYRKVATGLPGMSWSESVDEALCFGWIDGVRKRIDEHSYSIRFTPRKASSIWSTVNIAKVEKLRAEGRLTPAGERAFALRSESRSGIYSHERERPAELSPAELQAFQRHAGAWQYFVATPPGYRNRMLHWITSAKRDDTRAARLAKLVTACGNQLRLD